MTDKHSTSRETANAVTTGSAAVAAALAVLLAHESHLSGWFTCRWVIDVAAGAYVTASALRLLGPVIFLRPFAPASVPLLVALWWPAITYGIAIGQISRWPAPLTPLPQSLSDPAFADFWWASDAFQTLPVLASLMIAIAYLGYTASRLKRWIGLASR